MRTRWLGLLGAGALLLAMDGARAQDYKPQAAGTFLVNLRVSDVSPDASDRIRTAAGVDSGLHVHVTDSVMPTLGLAYFLTDQLAVEAILGSTQHDVYARGPGTNVKVKSTWVIPPVVSLEYHPWPRARISPYVGAGVNAMIFHSGKSYNGFHVNLKDDVGAAVRGGADIALRGPWALNLDVKKVFVETDASIDQGALYSHVHLDPWVFSLGVGRRF